MFDTNVAPNATLVPDEILSLMVSDVRTAVAIASTCNSSILDIPNITSLDYVVY